MQQPEWRSEDEAADAPLAPAEERELTERFRVELLYFAHQQRGIDAAEAERALEQTTEHLVRLARDFARRQTRPHPHGG